MTIQKAAAAGVCAALIALQFKGGKTEYGIYVSIAAGLLLAAGILGKLDTVLATVREIGSSLQRSKDLIWCTLKDAGHHICGGVCLQYL
ncbi:MAG: SpoIIIAC/SpoIIIAD family protein [Sellimonas intestinalis]